MFNTIILKNKIKLLLIIGNTLIYKIYVIKFIVASLNYLDHIKSGEKKKGQLTYFFFFFKKIRIRLHIWV